MRTISSVSQIKINAPKPELKPQQNNKKTAVNKTGGKTFTQITQKTLIELLSKYQIPVAQETVSAIYQIPVYEVEGTLTTIEK